MISTNAISVLLALLVGFTSYSEAQDLCACPPLNIAFLIDRTYFTPLRFNTVAKPIVDDIAIQLPYCSDVRVAFVEYGATTNFRVPFDKYTPSTSARAYMTSYNVSYNLGTFSLLGDGLEAIRTEAMNPATGYRPNVPTFTIVLIGSAQLDPEKMSSESAALKSEGDTIIVVGYGSSYNKTEVAAVATSPSYFYQSDFFGTEVANISSSIVNQLARSSCSQNATTVTSVATTTTSAVTTTSFASSTTGAATTSSTSSAGSSTPSPCPKAYVVFIFERSYFDQVSFDKQVQPILTNFASYLGEFQSVNVAFVEYGSQATIRYNYNSFTSLAQIQQVMTNYTLGAPLGSGSALDLAYGLVSSRILNGNPSYVYTFLGNNPTNAVATTNAAHQVQLQFGVNSLFSYGSNVDRDYLRSLASAPDYYVPVELVHGNYAQISNMMVVQICPNAIVPGPTGPPLPVCKPYPDVVFLFDRTYFYTANFDLLVQPILTDFAYRLPLSADLRAAFVEYGPSPVPRYYYSSFSTSDQVRQFMTHYPLGSTSYLGDASNLDQAFQFVSNSVLEEARGRDLTNPTNIFVFLGTQPASQNAAFTQAENLRLNGGVISVLAYGSSWNKEFLQALSNSPDLFTTIDDTQKVDSVNISHWMVDTVCNITSYSTFPPKTSSTTQTPAQNPTVPTVPTTHSTKSTTTSNIPTTSSSTTLSTSAPSIGGTASSSSVSSSVTSSTLSQTTTYALPTCNPVPDVVFVFDMSYFDNTTFEQYVQPVLTGFAKSLDPTANLRVAFVEYGPFATECYGFNSYVSNNASRQLLENYPICTSGYLGYSDNLDKALALVTNEILTVARPRDLSNPTNVFVFVGRNPADQNAAFSQSNILKSAGGVISILAYGDFTNTVLLQPIASVPAYYRHVDEKNFQSADYSSWMATTVCTLSYLPPTTTTVAITTAPTPSQSVSTGTTPSTTTFGFPTYNPVPDVVFVFDRTYFDNVTFEEYIQSVLTVFADKLNPKSNLRVAFVEYGPTATACYTYASYTSNQASRELLRNYTLCTPGYIGDSDNLDQALKLVNTNILAAARPRDLSNPTNVFVFIGRNPADENAAISQADNLRGGGGVISVLAYGTYTDADLLQMIANTPGNYKQIYLETFNAIDIGTWMANIVNTIYLPPIFEPCNLPYDVVFVIDRVYFNPATFNQTIHQAFAVIAKSVPPGVDLRGSIVEYGTTPSIQFYLNTYVPTKALLNELNIYQVGPALGSQSDLGSALKTVRKQVLRTVKGQRSVPPAVMVFLGNDPTDEVSAVDEAELLRAGDAAVISVFAYGNDYTADNVRIIANGPNYFFAVTNQSSVNMYFLNLSVELYTNCVGTSPVTPIVTLPTIPTTFLPPCCPLDVVIVVDRAYFDAAKYDSVAIPVLQEFFNQLPACADVRVAIIEYSSSVLIRHRFNDDKTSTKAVKAVADYEPSATVGPDSYADDAFNTISTQLVLPSSGHRNGVPIVTLVFVGTNPSDEQNAIVQANVVKSFPGSTVTVTVFAFGSGYAPSNLGPLATDSDFYFEIPTGSKLGNYTDLPYDYCGDVSTTISGTVSSTQASTTAPSSTESTTIATSPSSTQPSTSAVATEASSATSPPATTVVTIPSSATSPSSTTAATQPSTGSTSTVATSTTTEGGVGGTKPPSTSVGTVPSSSPSSTTVVTIPSSPTTTVVATQPSSASTSTPPSSTSAATIPSSATTTLAATSPSSTTAATQPSSASTSTPPSSTSAATIPSSATTTLAATSPSSTTVPTQPSTGSTSTVAEQTSTGQTSTTEGTVPTTQQGTLPNPTVPPTSTVAASTTTVNASYGALCVDNRQESDRYNADYFLSNPADCHTFYQCFFFADDAATVVLQKCSPGTHWSSVLETCILEGTTSCTDACSENLDLKCYASNTSCAEFFFCSNGASYRTCCPEGTGFNEATCACDSVVDCEDNCTFTQWIPPSTPSPIVVDNTTCIDSYNNTLQVYPGYPNRFLIVTPDSSVYSLICAEGTIFDLNTCRCEMSSEETGGNFSSSSQALLYLPLTTNFDDYSIEKFKVYNFSHVQLTFHAAGPNSNDTSFATFTGGRLEVPGLKNADLRDQVSWCLFYRCEEGNNTYNCSTEAGLLSNSNGLGLQYSIILVSYNETIAANLKFASGATISLSAQVEPFNNGWIQACVTVGQGVAKLYTNGRVADTENVQGKLAYSNYPFTVGEDQAYGHFIGSVSDVLVLPHIITQEELDAYYAGDTQQLIALGVLPPTAA